MAAGCKGHLSLRYSRTASVPRLSTLWRTSFCGLPLRASVHNAAVPTVSLSRTLEHAR
jgi:hypothetical protein